MPQPRIGTAPRHVGQGPIADAGDLRDVVESGGAAVFVEGREVALIRGGVEIEQAVVVVIAAFHAHGALGVAAEIVGQAGEEADFFEFSRAVVLEDEVAGDVVADDDVRIAVVVEVGADHPHPGSLMGGHAGGHADVGKRAVAVVAVERIRRGVVVERADVAGIAVETADLVVLGTEPRLRG